MSLVKPRVRVSGLDILLGCPGSARLVRELGLRRWSDVESWEGQWVHHAAAKELVEVHGAVAPAGLEAPKLDGYSPSEFARWKKDYYVREVLEEAGLDRALVVEDELAWEFEAFVLTGHPDVTTFTGGAERIGIDDCKSGSNLVDAAECNWQMAGYAALRKLQFPQAVGIRTRIIQPSAPEEVRVTAFDWEGDLLERLPGLLEAQVVEALKRDGLLRTGKHCRWCDGWHNCPAIMAEIELTKALLAELKTTVTAGGRPTTEQLARLAVAFKRLDGPLKAAREELKGRLEAEGTQVLEDGTQLFLKDGMGPRKIAVAEAWETIVNLLGMPPELAYSVLTISPDELERALAKHLNVPQKSKKGEDARAAFATYFGAFTTREPRKELVVT